MMAEYKKIAHISAIPEGEGRSFDIEGQQLGIFNIKGKFHAINNTCPHAGGPLGEGVVDNEKEVICPWHGWRFDVSTGACLINPAYTQKKYPIKIENDVIYVEIKN